jgi:three-Cys-motif partner protein
VTRIPYEFVADGPLAIVKQHSVAKHDVLRAYLVEYIQTLVVSPAQEELRVTLVDGFAGGGIYRHEATQEVVLGSPLVMLEAAKEAEFLINQGRQRPLKMNIDYFFVEVKKDAFDLLSKTLGAHGYTGRVGNDIKLFNSKFDVVAPSISEFIGKKSPRSGRSIFFLDQYGYSDVPTSLIRSILQGHPSSEVILTFNVDAFINYASDQPATSNLLQKIGIPDILRGRTIDDIKSKESDFRLFIQSVLYRDLVEACGARYYTLFFIRTSGHGDYWLVHLSQHPRARDVMTRIHWKKNNNFIHYGGAGIDMFHALGYSSDRDDNYKGQSDLGFCFDDVAGNASTKALMQQLPHIIYAHQDGISFGELFATTCNTSPADSLKYKEALAQLVGQKDIEIISPDGSRRLKASTIGDKDQLVPSRQTSFGF